LPPSIASTRPPRGSRCKRCSTISRCRSSAGRRAPVRRWRIKCRRPRVLPSTRRDSNLHIREVDLQRSPKIAELATLLLALVVFDIAINITLLGPFMILGLFYPAAVYLLVVKNLTGNIAVARNASLVIAILTGLHWLVALVSMKSKVMAPVTFIIM